MKYEEGLIKIFVPDRQKLMKKNEIFLNVHKKFDRDLNVFLVKALKLKGKTYLELMGASGIRGLRLGKETKAFKKIIINDYKLEAVRNAEKNAEENKVKIESMNEDAKKLLSNLNQGVDYVDVDPFGSPIYYVRSACLALSRNGVLSITSTDTGALSGTFPKACRRRYHAVPYKTEFYYENGLRILAKAVIEEASIHDIALVPFFAHATRHYFRIYFRKVKGAKETDELMRMINYLSYCPDCLERSIGLKEVCGCGKKRVIIGPLFTGKLYDISLVKRMKKSGEYEDFFDKIIEEAGIDVPWFYTTDSLARKYKICEPRMRDLKCARTHINPKGFKTSKSVKEILATLPQ